MKRSLKLSHEFSSALASATLAALAGLSAGAAFTIAARPAQAQTAPAGATAYRMSGYSLALPSDWMVERRRGGEEIAATSPDGGRTLMVWWWLPDEPLLGYPDIVSHKKIVVAGRPALRVHVRSRGGDTLSVTFDAPRSDGKRLRLMLEAGASLGSAALVFDAALASLAFEPETARTPPVRRPTTPAPALPASSPVAARTLAPAPPARLWLGPVSLDPPEGWSARREASARTLTLARPDGRARIVLSLWPRERPMPAQGLERVEQVVLAGAPTTRLTQRAGAETIEHVFFDEPFPDGSRLALSYAVKGEALGDNEMDFDFALASLSRDMPAPPGAGGGVRASAKPGDPFAGLSEADLLKPSR